MKNFLVLVVCGMFFAQGNIAHASISNAILDDSSGNDLTLTFTSSIAEDVLAVDFYKANYSGYLGRVNTVVLQGSNILLIPRAILDQTGQHPVELKLNEDYIQSVGGQLTASTGAGICTPTQGSIDAGSWGWNFITEASCQIDAYISTLANNGGSGGGSNNGGSTTSLWSLVSNTIISFFGKVGIGTNSPTEALEVVGTIKATAFKAGSIDIKETTSNGFCIGSCNDVN